MNVQLSKKIQYTQTLNGVEVYALKTSSKDVVTCKMALPGGANAVYNKRSVAMILGDMLPGGTQQKKKSVVLERIESLGASVTMSFSNEYLLVTIACRNTVFAKVFALLIEVLTMPALSDEEFKNSQAKMMSVCKNLSEDAGFQASTALSHLLFKKGHPHWTPDTEMLLADIGNTTNKEVRSFHGDILTSKDVFVCVAGDIKVAEVQKEIVKHLSNLPDREVERVLLMDSALKIAKTKDVQVFMKDKFNVDTMLGIPLMLKHTDSDYEALQFGVSILGSSSTSRLFNVLRTQKNLTYGAYASVSGFEGGYGGFLRCRAQFPTDVYAKGKEEMGNVVKDFVENGVTSHEVKERKVESLGKYVITLSTSAGVCDAMIRTLLLGRPISYIDSVTENMKALTTKKVNTAVQKHIDFSIAGTAAAGAMRS